MTLAERYNDKCREIMRGHPDLIVSDDIDDAEHIDEIVWHRSEYLGGMCAVILELVK